MSVVLRLLGVPKIEQESGFDDLPLDKPASLLYYLSQRADWVSRSELAFLYRPDAPEKLALSNVRNFVHRAKQHTWAEQLEVSKFRVRYQPKTDVHAFNQAIEQQNWSEALMLYEGDFLAGMHLQDVPSYETWLELERQDLSQKWRLAALQQVEPLVQAQDGLAAEALLERVLKHDPFDEEAMQAYLKVLFAEGKRLKATQVFEHFEQDLKQELDVEPLETTKALFKNLNNAKLGALQSADPQSPQGRQKHNLPAQTTRFIGRKRELKRLSELLAKDDCRLVSLVGLGGVGKTRLALELATSQLERFKDAVYFVPLAGVTSTDLIASNIATAIGLNLTAKHDPKEQLSNFLSTRELLLLIDNFEHLLEGAVLLEELLEAAPKLKLIVTTRVALELRSEWLSDLSGLAYPPSDSKEVLDSFDAVRLFNNRAERFSASFTAEGKTLEAVAELSRKVEGLPLALELAATWTRSLSVAQLNERLDTSFEILSSQQRDLPERHRSLRNVFHYSWQRLSEREQAALAKLSIFQGGFSLDAAQNVAEANLAILLSLINHSLIKRSESDRYDMHPLVKEFAFTEGIAGITNLNQRDLEFELRESHANYYLNLVDTLNAKRNTDEQAKAIQIFVQAFNNISAAWLFAAQHNLKSLIDPNYDYLYNLLSVSNNFYQGTSLFEKAINDLQNGALASDGELIAKLSSRQAFFFLKTGDFTRSRKALEISLELTKTLTEKIRTLHNLANLAYTQGDHEDATENLEAAYVIHKKHNPSPELFISTLFNLSVMAWTKGDYQKAKDYNEETLPIIKKLNDKRGYARYYDELGKFANLEKDYKKAKYYREKGLGLREELGDKEQVAATLGNLAEVYGKLEDYEAQLKCHQRALEIFKSVKNQLHIALETYKIGECILRSGNAEGAKQNFQEALALAQKIEATPISLLILRGFARLYASKSPDRAGEILSFAIQHTSTLQNHRDSMKEILSELSLTEEALTKARASANNLDLDILATELLA